MEAKGFFSKSSNILSVAILVAGLTTFGAGIHISDTNAKDMQKQTNINKRQVKKLKKSLLEQTQQKEFYMKQEQQEKNVLDLLLKENNDLKKQITTYKNRSVAPSPVSQPIKTPVRTPVTPVQSSQKKVSVVATAYIASCEGCSGVTATGINVRNGNTYNGQRIIATDPNIVPLHSKVRIDTQNGQSFIAVVEDTGGAIKGGKIDVLVDNYSQAINFGRQNATITILREGA